MTQLWLNNFETQFIAAVKDTPTSGTPATELDYGILRISDGAAGSLITPGAGNYYILTAYKRAGTVESNYEVMKVTLVDNSVPGECRITVNRAQEGTTAQAYVAGDRIALRITKAGLDEMIQTSEIGVNVQAYDADTTKNDVANIFTQNQTIQGNLSFDGLIRRILADFSDATGSNRAAFQTSVVNGGSTVNVLPNGSGNFANYAVFDSSDADNAGYGYFGINPTDVRINTNKTGTGTAKPLAIYTNSIQRLRIETDGAWGLAGTNCGTAGQAIKSQGAGLPPVWGDVAGAGANSNITSLSAVTSINGGPLAGFRNRLINGGFAIDQRNNGAINSTSGSSSFSCDRWQLYLQAGTSAQRVSGDANSRYALRLLKSSGTSTGSLFAATALETNNSIPLAGKTVTLSFRARVGSTYTGTATPAKSLCSGTGTDQSIWSGPISGTWTGQSNLTATTIANPNLTTTFQTYSFNYTIPSNATQIGLYIGQAMSASTGTANDYIEFTDLQLEVGAVATQFEQRHYSTELALCECPSDTSALGFTRGLIAASINGGQLAGMRNKIINGGFEVHQRGSAAVASGQFPADRTYINYSGSNCSAIATSGQSVNGTNCSAIVVTGAAGNTSVGFVHTIESRNAKSLAGKAATLSYWLYHDLGADHNASPAIYYMTTVDGGVGGIADAVSGRTPASTTCPSGVWTKVVMSCTLHANSANGLVISIGLPATVSGKTLKIAMPQLEEGSVATPFEQRPYGTELQLCQRYYYDTGVSLYMPGVLASYHTTGNACGVYLPFPVQMRATPNATVSGTFTLSNVNAQPTIGAINEKMAYLLSNITTTGAAGFYSNSSGKVIFEKEL